MAAHATKSARRTGLAASGVPCVVSAAIVRLRACPPAHFRPVPKHRTELRAPTEHGELQPRAERQHRLRAPSHLRAVLQQHDGLCCHLVRQPPVLRAAVVLHPDRRPRHLLRRVKQPGAKEHSVRRLERLVDHRLCDETLRDGGVHRGGQAIGGIGALLDAVAVVARAAERPAIDGDAGDERVGNGVLRCAAEVQAAQEAGDRAACSQQRSTVSRGCKDQTGRCCTHSP